MDSSGSPAMGSSAKMEASSAAVAVLHSSASPNHASTPCLCLQAGSAAPWPAGVTGMNTVPAACVPQRLWGGVKYGMLLLHRACFSISCCSSAAGSSLHLCVLGRRGPLLGGGALASHTHPSIVSQVHVPSPRPPAYRCRCRGSRPCLPAWTSGIAPGESPTHSPSWKSASPFVLARSPQSLTCEARSEGHTMCIAECQCSAGHSQPHALPGLTAATSEAAYFAQ